VPAQSFDGLLACAAGKLSAYRSLKVSDDGALYVWNRDSPFVIRQRKEIRQKTYEMRLLVELASDLADLGRGQVLNPAFETLRFYEFLIYTVYNVPKDHFTRNCQQVWKYSDIQFL
jgi:hypothetical protein